MPRSRLTKACFTVGSPQAAEPSARWACADLGQLKAKRDSAICSGSAGLLKLTSSTSCPSFGTPFAGEKPKSPSRETRAAPLLTTPWTKEFGAKSSPTVATSVGSIASGILGSCGGEGGKGLPRRAFGRTAAQVGQGACA